MEPRGTPLELPAGEAHLWLRFTAGADDGAVRDAERWMSGDERARQARFAFPELRRDFALARGVVRATLSRYTDVEPGGWTFRANQWGRPEIDAPERARALRFNLSHTRGLIAVLVAWGREVGVDVEDGARGTATGEVAERFFAPAEVRALRGLRAEQQRERFFTYWTLKEAYIKARGMGLAIPLERFAFALPEDGPNQAEGAVRVALDPALGDAAERWQFARYRPSERHFMASAIEVRPGEAPVRVVLRELS